jgi:hypothetical protein
MSAGNHNVVEHTNLLLTKLIGSVEIHYFASFRYIALRGCIQKFPDWVDNEMYAYLWYYSLTSNTKSYGGKTHYTDPQNSDTAAPSGNELYHLHFWLQSAGGRTQPVPFGTAVCGYWDRSFSPYIPTFLVHININCYEPFWTSVVFIFPTAQTNMIGLFLVFLNLSRRLPQ